MPKIARDQAAREASRSAGVQATLRTGQGSYAPSPASAMDDFDDEIDTADPRKHLR